MSSKGQYTKINCFRKLVMNKLIYIFNVSFKIASKFVKHLGMQLTKYKI